MENNETNDLLIYCSLLDCCSALLWVQIPSITEGEFTSETQHTCENLKNNSGQAH